MKSCPFSLLFPASIIILAEKEWREMQEDGKKQWLESVTLCSDQAILVPKSIRHSLEPQSERHAAARNAVSLTDGLPAPGVRIGFPVKTH